jgi:hypothetical protein
MGYHYLLYFRKGWSGVAYAEGGIKVASKHLPRNFENSKHISSKYFQVISLEREIP